MNKLKYQNSLALILLLIPLITFAQLKIPDGFSEVIESSSNGKQMAKVFLDFDKDLEEDTAVIVENTSLFSAYKFLLYISSQNKTYAVDLISLQETSVYPVPIKLRNNVLEFGYFEAGTSAFGRFIKLRYNDKNKEVEVIGYDVSYKSSPSEYINKSYNLITGNYIVKRTHYNDRVSVQEFSGTNDFFKNKVFIENLNNEVIVNLDDVGSKYE